MVRPYYLATDSNCILFVAVANEFGKTSTKSSTNEDRTGIIIDPNDFHDSMVDVSEEIGNKSDNSKLSNVDKFSEHLSGRYYYKK